jgi:lysosomal alpha-mannosidase
MGFDAYFFSRMAFEEKALRESNKAMEYIHRPFSSHFNTSKQIFTYVTQDLYCWPDDFWFDDRYFDDTVVNDTTLETFNAEEKMNKLLGTIYYFKSIYQGNQMLMLFGCDFAHANAMASFL